MISVLLVEPNKYPKMIEIEDSLEAMQKIVVGDIEESLPPSSFSHIRQRSRTKSKALLPTERMESINHLQ